MNEKLRSHRELRVYQGAFQLAQEIFDLTKTFPNEEKYSLIDQWRRSSRSVCANLGEAWRKRRYTAAFVAKLVDCEAEAGESQVWAEMALANGYISQAQYDHLYDAYEHVISQLILMIQSPGKWTPQRTKART